MFHPAEYLAVIQAFRGPGGWEVWVLGVLIITITAHSCRSLVNDRRGLRSRTRTLEVGMKRRL